MSTKPLLSVLTVVYNGEKLLQKTIDSVCNQTYKEIEHIIVDGNSTDNTLAIIRQNESRISRWVSEPDQGIYDAMNKALQMANGDYVLFLNAGDLLADHGVIEAVFNLSCHADIYYGETMIIDPMGNEIGLRRLQSPRQLSWKSFRWGMLVCHQSILIKRTITEPYNLSYRIASDYDWVLRCLKKSKVIVNTHQIISKFESGGVSSKNITKANRERFKSMCAHYGVIPSIGFNFLMFFRLIFTYLKNGRL